MSIADKYRPQFTIEDFNLWEGRWELIDGMPYSTRPDVPHQSVTGDLMYVIHEALKKHCSTCHIYLPIGWKIDDRNIVQPDLTIIHKDFEKNEHYLTFTPSIIVEIASAATAFKDRHEKFELYEQEKVAYYIIVDMQLLQVEIYELIKDKYVLSQVPVNQFEFILKSAKPFSINFDEIWP